MELSQGSIDFGMNLPAQDIVLIGPTVELVARKGLHPALSDLLLEVAQEVHGKASILQKRGEFPAPIEHEFTISDDALRYYKSGKGLLYRAVGSFWLASLINRILVVFVPTLLVLIPALRFFPTIYKLRTKLQIYRRYRRLLLIRTGNLRPTDARAGPGTASADRHNRGGRQSPQGACVLRRSVLLPPGPHCLCPRTVESGDSRLEERPV